MKKSSVYIICICSWLLSGLCVGTAFAQAERFELGQRLRACEAAWEAQPDAAARRRAVEPLKQSVQFFFALKLGEAAHALDQARFLLRTAEEPTPFVRWAASLSLRPGSRLLDAAESELPLTLEQFYTLTEGWRPADARLRVSLWDGKRSLVKPQEFSLTTLPLSVKLPLRELEDGDYTLRAEIVAGQYVLFTNEQTLSVAAKLKMRLDKLQQATDSLKANVTDAETARALAKLLSSLAQRQTLETNYPAARLLAQAEAVVQAANTGRSFYGQRKTGQYWLALVAAHSVVPVRLLAPETVKRGVPLPLVIALHGAGGSENMFFEGYGRGASAKLCEQRGWLLVTPRGSTGFTPGRAAELVEAVNQLYPVDRQRVFLVGHSMGAAQAVASVLQTPLRFAGVAALGGGGVVREVPDLTNVPFFVGVGTEDFAQTNARKLGFELRKAGVKTVKFREYPDVEHLVIVQAALPDVFVFFDSLLQQSAKPAPQSLINR